MTFEQWWMYVQIMLGFDAFIFLIIIYVGFWRKRGRIKVRIKTPMGEKTKWVKPDPDGKTLVIEKGSDRQNKPKWSATFSNKSLVAISRWLFRKAYAVDVFYNATECIEYDYSLKTSDAPKWSKKQSKEYIEAEVLKQRGKRLKYEMPTLFWLIFIICLINLVISFVLAQRLQLF